MGRALDAYTLSPRVGLAAVEVLESEQGLAAWTILDLPAVKADFRAQRMKVMEAPP